MFALVDIVMVLAVLTLGVLAAVAVVSAVTRRQQTALAHASWRAAHHSRGGRTHILVQRQVHGTGQVLEERLLGEVADDDPDYDALFLERMAEARARAALLNSEDASAD